MKSLNHLVLATVIATGTASAQTELYRPQFHFTPFKNWMNDPNGLVYYQGEYHLFFQHNPSGINAGNLSWGHAVSRDLVRWQELPVALTPNNGVLIFSGSAVIDWNNTSGFQTGSEPPMIAIYTGAGSSTQDQRIAYSNDRGRTFTQYSGNPVIPTFGDPDFRDPKVFWHAESGKWVMVVSVSTKKKLRIYGSPNLKSWTLLSEFTPADPRGGVWECPDLFKLPVAGEGVSKWVMLNSVGSGAPSGTWGYQYYVGNFDGTAFTAEIPAPSAAAGDVVLNDFENPNYGDWTTTGTAFGTGPATGPFSQQQAISGYQGSRFVNSFLGGDASTGTLTSPPFQITRPYLNFLIGGGGIAGQTCINLYVNGSLVRTATGANSETLAWQHWDVSQYSGMSAQIQIVDSATGGWGHVNVDQITLSNSIILDRNAGGAQWAEYGPDQYAPNTWGGIPDSDGRRILTGWMVSIDYLNAVPTTPWRGNHSVPRELGLVRTSQGLRLTQKPVEEIKSLRGRNLHHDPGTLADVNAWLAAQDVPKLFDCEVELQAPVGGTVGLTLGNQTQKTYVYWDRAASTLTVDRTASGAVSFSSSFPKVFSAPIISAGGSLRLRLLMDSDTLEIFGDNGAAILSSLVFPDAATRGISLYGSAGAAVGTLDIWEMGSRFPVAPYSAGSLVARWPFDEGTPGTYADTSGQGNTMTKLSGPDPAVAAGVSGNAMEIRRQASTSANTVMAVPTSLSLTNDSFTVSYFFNPKSNNGTKLPQIHWESPSGLGWGFEILANRQMNFYVYARGTANDVQSVATLPLEAYDESGGTGDNVDNDPTWHHVAATYDAVTGYLTLWLDGVKSQKTATGLSARPNYGTVGDGGGLRIDTGLTIYDDLRIYRGVLSDADIASLRSQPTATTIGQGPPPATPALGINRLGSSTFVSWPARTGLALWTSPDLSPGSWTKVTGSENLTSYGTVTATQARRFFRLATP